MKSCPSCHRNYKDDSLSFCLEDGSQLSFALGVEAATLSDTTDVLENTLTLSERQYLLRVVDGPATGSVYLLSRRRMTIGRSTDCDLSLADARISRTHCAIEWNNLKQAFTLFSFGNWTLVLVNDVRVNGSVELAVEDLLRLGSSTLVFAQE